MKKFITRSLFAFVIMGYALVSVNAATEFTYEGWKDGSGYGTKEQYTDYITTMTGEYNDTAGMFYGPYNKESEQTLEEGINEELLIDLDFDNMGLNELFEISLAFNDANGDYLDEVVVMTQLFEEGKIKLSAGWAPEFEVVVEEDGLYTYRWEAYIESEKAYVKFTLLKGNTVVGTTGAIERASINAEDVSVRYLWFCNVNVANGVNLYSRLPKLTVDADTNSDYVTVVDEEKAATVLESSAKVDLFTRYDVKRFDTLVTGEFEVMTKDEMKQEDEDTFNLFEEEIENDTIVNFFMSSFIASVDEDNINNVNPVLKYSEGIELSLNLPTDLPAVAKGYERKYYLIKFDMADFYDDLIELLEVDPDALNNLEMVDLMDLEVVEPTLSKDGKKLSFTSDSYDVYALSYVDSELPPQTGDNIVTYVIIGLISMLGLVVLGKKTNKLFN